MIETCDDDPCYYESPAMIFASTEVAGRIPISARFCSYSRAFPSSSQFSASVEKYYQVSKEGSAVCLQEWKKKKKKNG